MLFINVEEVQWRAKQIINLNSLFLLIKKSNLHIYGVPRGGIGVAFAFSTIIPNSFVVTDPLNADIIVDDIIDSGGTKARYNSDYPNIPFFALVDKEKEGITDWVIFPWEQTEEKSIEDSVVRQLQFIGEDSKREGLLETPARVVKSWKELYSGYKQDIKSLFTTFESDTYDQIVLLKNVELFSTCEHHMLPFFGKAHIAYLPDKKVIGISKLARLLEAYSRRLQIQERIGEQVVDALMKYLQPKGAACIIEASHLCMRMRGVSKQNSTMVTSSLRGVFLEKSHVKDEFIRLIKL